MPDYAINFDEEFRVGRFKLMQLPDDVVDHVEAKGSMRLLQDMEGHALVTTDDSTYEVKALEYSNALLITSLHPPTLEGIVYSLSDRVLELKRTRPQLASVLGIIRSHVLRSLETTDFSDAPTTSELLTRVCCSHGELENFLHDSRCVCINNNWVLIDSTFLYELTQLRLLSRLPSNTPKELVDFLEESLFIEGQIDYLNLLKIHLRHAFQLRNMDTFEINVLRQALILQYQDVEIEDERFFDEATFVSLLQTTGLIYLHRDLIYPCFVEDLPGTFEGRVYALFSTRPGQWRIDELEPFLIPLLEHDADLNSKICQYCRPVMTSNPRSYVLRR